MRPETIFMNAPTTQQMIAATLWAAPAVQTLMTLGIVWFASTLRRNFGAQSSNAGILVAFAAVMLALHVGYFLAPMWWKSGRHLLGAATMLPIALLVLGSMVVAVSQTEILTDVARWGVMPRVAVIAGAALVVLAYVVPLTLMLAGTR
jgi:hypothetical protein